MHWKQNRLKPLPVSARKREEKRLKQAKRINLILFIIVIIGCIIIFITTTKYNSEPVVSINFNDQQGTMREWVHSGFVMSLDDSTGTLVLNEALWNKLSTAQKESTVILLRAYYARMKGIKESKMIIKGNVSGQLLVSTEVVSISCK